RGSKMTTNIVLLAYCQAHQRVADYLHKLSDEQLRWQLNRASLPIAWHGWHLARWADYFQVSVAGMTPALGQLLGEGVQIWQREGLAAKWGFDSAALGYSETGMNMADRSEEHTSELQSRENLVCRLLLEK